MARTIQVKAARIPDRDRLLRELARHGISGRPVDELGIDVPLDDDAHVRQVASDVFSHVERTIMLIGAPFVPIEHDGVIYIRPPLS